MSHCTREKEKQELGQIINPILILLKKWHLRPKISGTEPKNRLEIMKLFAP